MISVYLAAFLLCGQVEARTTDGEKTVGDLRTWDSEAISLQVEDGTRRIPVARLQQWRNLSERSTPPDLAPKVWVALRDGSRLAAEQVTAAEGRLEVATIGGPLTVSLRDVRSIRLRPASAEWDAEWTRVVDRPFAGDALVIRRGSRRLDFLEGSIANITPATVGFRYDDQVTDIPRSRLEGLVLFQPQPAQPASPAFVVALRDGSRWHGLSAEMTAGQLRVRLSQQITLETPLANVVEVSFAASNITFVSDLACEQITMEPMWDSRFARETVESFLYQPQWDRGFAGRTLQLQMDESGSRQSFEKGIALHGQTSLRYRLQQPYRELRGLAGFDPELGQHGTARLTIRADGVEIVAKDIPRGGPPLVIAVPLAETRRLEIELSSLDGFDNGDFVNLCRLRLIR